MGSLKKKPKPFSKMSKVLCTGVQSRRIMVLTSLVLVMLGCLALYSAMQNEEWTQDEPCQRKVFLVAFLLLITSVALCYYALNGELEEDKERLEAEILLTSVKYGDYSSLKPNTLVTYPEQFKTNQGMEQEFLKLLQPNKKEVKRNKRGRNADIKENVQLSRNQEVELNRKDDLNNSEIPPVFKIADTSKHLYNQVQSCASNDNQYQEQPRTKSLLVELMPLLPLQLCEKELAKINSSSPILDKSKLGKPLVFPKPKNNRFIPDIPNQFVQDDKNADAG